MDTATEARKNILEQHGLSTKLSPEEAKVVDRQRRLSTTVFRPCYFENNPMSWKIANNVYEFLELADSEPTKASQLLIDLCPREGSKNIVNCKQVLERLRSYAQRQYLTCSDRKAVFDVLSQTADHLSKAMGPREPFECTVTLMCCKVAQEIIYRVEGDLRLNAILEGIEHGSAFSWLMYFVRMILMEHQKINVRRMMKWIVLSDLELEEIRKAALKRIISSTDQIYESAEPNYIFISWHELSEDKTQLLRWVDKHIETDVNLVNFTGAFRAICISEGALRWKVQDRDLEKFVNIDTHKLRLRKVMEQNSDLSRSAKILLSEF